MTQSTAIGLGALVADRYELVAVRGRGDMGTVYEAIDREGGCKAAVKVLRAEYLGDDAMRRRFRREGAVLKSLTHPAFVRLLDLGVSDDGVVYLVTEYVEGRTLAERIEETPLELGEADELVEALSSGLAAAHEHGILHGDLKPANVLWSADSRPATARLVDFSASKILGLDRLTATGEISGTPAYMAPEVLTGESDVDARIDVYGLGVLLYEALSGKQAFRDGHVGRLLMKIDAGDCFPLDAVAPVPSPLARVVGRAMHRNRDERYPLTTDLRAAWYDARKS